MGIFSSGPLSNQALGILPGDTSPLPPRPTFPDVLQKKQGSGFGGKLSTIAGVLGDALLSGQGRNMMFTPNLLQQRQQQRELELAQQRRQQDLEDQIQLAQVKAGMREPSDLQQRVEYLNKLKPGLGDQYAAVYAEGPPVAVDVAAPDGSVTRQFLPRSSMGGGKPAQPQPGQIEDGYRFKGGNAADPNAWEPVGGPSQPATGIFPGR